MDEVTKTARFRVVLTVIAAVMLLAGAGITGYYIGYDRGTTRMGLAADRDSRYYLSIIAAREYELKVVRSRENDIAAEARRIYSSIDSGLTDARGSIAAVRSALITAIEGIKELENRLRDRGPELHSVDISDFPPLSLKEDGHE